MAFPGSFSSAPFPAKVSIARGPRQPSVSTWPSMRRNATASCRHFWTGGEARGCLRHGGGANAVVHLISGTRAAGPFATAASIAAAVLRTPWRRAALPSRHSSGCQFFCLARAFWPRRYPRISSVSATWQGGRLFLRARNFQPAGGSGGPVAGPIPSNLMFEQ
jgi:hypothetical protein